MDEEPNPKASAPVSGKGGKTTFESNPINEEEEEAVDQSIMVAQSL